MTSKIRSYIEYLIQTYYILVNFVVEIGDKSSHNGGFKYDLMMINDSGLFFWTPYRELRKRNVIGDQTV